MSISSDVLARNIIKLRQKTVQIVGMRLIIQRPTDFEIIRYQELTRTKLAADLGIEFLVTQIVGWEGVKEVDIIPGGADELLDYDARLMRLWLEDNTDVWDDIRSAIWALVDSHRTSKAQALKN